MVSAFPFDRDVQYLGAEGAQQVAVHLFGELFQLNAHRRGQVEGRVPCTEEYTLVTQSRCCNDVMRVI